MENRYHTADIIGKTVVDEQGKKIGTVEDISLDPQRWSIEGIVVDLDDEAAEYLGEKRPMFGHAKIDISVPRIANAADYIILNGSLRDIAMALRESQMGEGPGHGGPR